MSIKSSSKLKKILEVKRIHSHLHKMTSAVKADLFLFLDDSCVWELHEQWEERISIWISTPKSGPGETKHLYKMRFTVLVDQCHFQCLSFQYMTHIVFIYWNKLNKTVFTQKTLVNFTNDKETESKTHWYFEVAKKNWNSPIIFIYNLEIYISKL